MNLLSRKREIEEILRNIESQNNRINKFISMITNNNSMNNLAMQKYRLEMELEQINQQISGIKNKRDNSQKERVKKQLKILLESKFLTQQEYDTFIENIDNGYSLSKIEKLLSLYENENLNIIKNDKTETELEDKEFIRLISFILHYVINKKNILPVDILFFQKILENNFNVKDKNILKEMFAIREEVGKKDLYLILDLFYNKYDLESFMQILYDLIIENKIDPKRYKEIKMYTLKRNKNAL